MVHVHEPLELYPEFCASGGFCHPPAASRAPRAATEDVGRRHYPRRGKQESRAATWLTRAAKASKTKTVREESPRRAIQSAAEALLQQLGPGGAVPRSKLLGLAARRETPREAPSSRSSTSLAWSGCTRGARLQFAGTVVSAVAACRLPAAGGSGHDLRSSPQCVAVGPTTAWKDLSTTGRYFEVHVETQALQAEHIALRSSQNPGEHQKPQLHIGVTSIPPEEALGPCDGLDAAVASSLEPTPYEREESCWTISTTGHVRANGKVLAAVPVYWPEPGSARSLHGQTGLRIGLLVTEMGALRLVVNGQTVASSSEILPRELSLQSAMLLRPLVRLGSNVARTKLLLPNVSLL